MTKRKPLMQAVIFLLLLVMTLTFLYPPFYMLVNSVKTKPDYLLNKFGINLGRATLDNYFIMLSQFKILRNFKNSIIITVFSVLLIVVFSVFASYAFAKMKFKGKELYYYIIISTMFIPAQVTMIPMYVMFAKAGLINKYASVILSYLAGGLPSAILLMTATFKCITQDLFEAAKIDGSNYFSTVKNVLIPMGAPAIFISIIFNFMGYWNDLFTPMILMPAMDKRTVMAALTSFASDRQSNPPLQMAGMFLSILPTLVVYLIFSKYIVKGISVGSIK